MTLTELTPDEQSWRDTGIRSRLAFALEQDGYRKDVTFLVGPAAEPIRAHRLILSLSSSQFDKLLENGGEDNDTSGATSGNIILEGVCPIVFKSLLKFIYTDKIEHEDVLEFLNFAKTFGFHYLDEICMKRWCKTGVRVTLENVMFVLTFLGRRGHAEEEQKDMEQLKEDCITFIIENTDKVMGQNSFNEISQQDLGLLLDSDNLVMEGGEFSVFLAVLRWAKYQCKLRGLEEAAPENLKNVLGNLRLKIRYSLLSGVQLITDVKRSGLLSAHELFQIAKISFNPTTSENTLGLSITPRSAGHCRRGISLSKVPVVVAPPPRRSDQRPVRRFCIAKLKVLKLDHIVTTVDHALNLPSSGSDSFPVPEAEQFPPQIPGTSASVGSNRMQEQPVIVEMPFPPTVFYRSNSTQDWNSLINAIGLGQNHCNLTQIVLRNVTLINFNTHGSNTPRLHLPDLKTFHYSLNPDPLLPMRFPDTSHPYFMNTRKFLLSLNSDWNFTQLPKLGLDICITISGINLMVLAPPEKKIILSYPHSEAGQAGRFILENCPIDTKVLCLLKARINSPGLLPTNLERVTLHGMETLGNKWTALGFLNKCPSLRHISFWETPKFGRLSQISLVSDLLTCRSTLKSLALAKTQIHGPSTRSLNGFVPFFTLQQLYLHHCSWTRNFPVYLRNAFPNLRRFGIRWELRDKDVTCLLLKSMLMNCTGLEHLVISCRNETAWTDHNDNLTTVEECWIQSFLVNVDLASTPQPLGDGDGRSQDLITCDTVLKKIDGVWTRMATTTVEEIHFKALKLGDFFENFQIYNSLLNRLE